MTFKELNLSAPLLRAVQEAGYETPSPIQAAAIPPVLSGRDLMGCAQTGTGKTAAFALPMLDRLTANAPRRKGAIRALILTPTRELALQIGESFDAYGKYLKLRSTVIFGGVGQAPQVEALKKGVDILIACPGRLNDLIGQGLDVYKRQAVRRAGGRCEHGLPLLWRVRDRCVLCAAGGQQCVGMDRPHRGKAVSPDPSAGRCRKGGSTMRRATAELIVKDPNKFAHHDRVFLNNPVVMQGMGLAPLVVLATSGQNAVMLAVAVALLLVPSRVLACLLSRLVPLHEMCIRDSIKGIGRLGKDGMKETNEEIIRLMIE